MKTRHLLLAAIGLAAWLTPQGWAAGRAQALGACTGQEAWQLPDDLSRKFQSEFREFLAGRSSPMRGLAMGIALRQQSAAQPGVRAFSEYWISRALFEARLIPIAAQGFTLLAASPASRSQAGIQLAALQCLDAIRSRNPAFGIPERVTQNLASLQALAETQPEREAIFNAALEMTADPRAVDRLLKDAPAWRSLHELQSAARAGNHAQSVEAGTRFLKESPLPPRLERYTDSAHLLVARALYSLGRPAEAVAHDRAISKKSNHLAQGIQEMAWALLASDRPGEAIGAALSLQAGGLRHTFVPEGPMVMAMAFNELCHFQESLQATQRFKNDYESSWNWLEAWSKRDPAGHLALYPLAVRFLKKDKTLDVPLRIATEWARSPVFQAYQEEINLLYDTRDAGMALSRAGALEMQELSLQIERDWRRLKPRVQGEHRRLKPGETLSSRLRDELAALKAKILAYRRMAQAAPALKNILASFEESSPSIRADRVERINRDLDERTRGMHIRLEEIAENNQLIEVEIFNGASQDIIFQNAHPEYRELAQKMKARIERASAEKVLDWGRISAASAEANAEIWEDELGTFQAELIDHCESKDKYLALRRKNP